MRSSIIFSLTLFGSIAFGAPTYKRGKLIPIAEYLDTTLPTEKKTGGAVDSRFKSVDKRQLLPIPLGSVLPFISNVHTVSNLPILSNLPIGDGISFSLQGGSDIGSEPEPIDPKDPNDPNDDLGQSTEKRARFLNFGEFAGAAAGVLDDIVEDIDPIFGPDLSVEKRSVTDHSPKQKRVKLIPIAKYLDTTLTETEKETGGALDSALKSVDKRQFDDISLLASLIRESGLLPVHLQGGLDIGSEPESNDPNEPNDPNDDLGQSTEKRTILESFDDATNAISETVFGTAGETLENVGAGVVDLSDVFDRDLSVEKRFIGDPVGKFFVDVATGATDYVGYVIDDAGNVFFY